MNIERGNELMVNGWKFGGVEDFIGLADEELEYIEIKINLGELVRKFRERKGLSQADAAEICKSSQAYLVKIETADPAVSIDLQINSLLAFGATRLDIGKNLAC